jgi:hypothetical protein
MLMFAVLDAGEPEDSAQPARRTGTRPAVVRPGLSGGGPFRPPPLSACMARTGYGRAAPA